MKTQLGRWRRLPRTGLWHYVAPGAPKSLCGRLRDDELTGGRVRLRAVWVNKWSGHFDTDCPPACRVCMRALSQGTAAR